MSQESLDDPSPHTTRQPHERFGLVWTRALTKMARITRNPYFAREMHSERQNRRTTSEQTLNSGKRLKSWAISILFRTHHPSPRRVLTA